MEGLRVVRGVKAIMVMVCTMIMFPCICGANLTVGGDSGWNLNSNIQEWATYTTFIVYDDLVFSYTLDHNVVEVNQQDYETCTTTNLAIYNTGDTVIPLTEPGERYFICTHHCQQGLKLHVLVQTLENYPYDTYVVDVIPEDDESTCHLNCVGDKSHRLWVLLITLSFTFAVIYFSS